MQPGNVLEIVQRALWPELVIIGKICEWCTGVHIVTFVIFVTTLTTVPKMLWPQHDNT